MRPFLNDIEGSGYSGSHDDVDPNNNFAPAIGSVILLTCAVIATYLVKKKCGIVDIDDLRRGYDVVPSFNLPQIDDRTLIMIEDVDAPSASPKKLTTIEEVDEGIERGTCRQLKVGGGYIESSV